ncbi:MAG: hypothetical protein MUC87_18965 [Bacteroidia bacterium]|jgi:hypothetical protein|nr:hypothetical protein [Bacteroidia bacterium]
MRVSLLLLTLMFALAMQAQTERISALSHNGTVQPQKPSHIPGIPSTHVIRFRIDSIVFVNDTTVVQYTNMGSHVVHRHVIANDPKISLDSLKKIYPNTKLVGFEKKTVNAGILKMAKAGEKSSLFMLIAFTVAAAAGLGWWQHKRHTAA